MSPDQTKPMMADFVTLLETFWDPFLDAPQSFLNDSRLLKQLWFSPLRHHCGRDDAQQPLLEAVHAFQMTCQFLNCLRKNVELVK